MFGLVCFKRCKGDRRNQRREPAECNGNGDYDVNDNGNDDSGEDADDDTLCALTPPGTSGVNREILISFVIGCELC